MKVEYVKCGPCGGKGFTRESEGKIRACSKCEATGTIQIKGDPILFEFSYDQDEVESQIRKKKCPECEGSGYVYPNNPSHQGRRCGWCGGGGEIELPPDPEIDGPLSNLRLAHALEYLLPLERWEPRTIELAALRLADLHRAGIKETGSVGLDDLETLETSLAHSLAEGRVTPETIVDLLESALSRAQDLMRKGTGTSTGTEGTST